MVSFEVVTSLVKIKLAFIINRAEYHQTELLRRIIIIVYDSSQAHQRILRRDLSYKFVANFEKLSK